MLRMMQASKCVETDVTDLRKCKLVNELADRFHVQGECQLHFRLCSRCCFKNTVQKMYVWLFELSELAIGCCCVQRLARFLLAVKHSLKLFVRPWSYFGEPRGFSNCVYEVVHPSEANVSKIFSLLPIYHSLE